VRLVVGSTEPQDAVQVTPALSLVVAATLAVALTAIDDGGSVLIATVMVFLVVLLHATRAAIMHKLRRRSIDLRNVIGHLR
jgi:K+ transporter